MRRFPRCSLVLCTLFFVVALLGGGQARGELHESEKIQRDLLTLTQGDYSARNAARTRLVARGAEVVSLLVPLLASDNPETRQDAAETLGLIGPDAEAEGLAPLLDAARAETDGLAMRWMSSAIQSITDDTRPLIELLLTHIERGDELAGDSAEELFDLEADLSDAKPVLIEALSAGWTDNKCYLFWVLDRKIGLTPDDLASLSRVELGPRPVYWERPGDGPGGMTDNYSECRDWGYVVEPLSEALRDDPAAYLAFLRNHPGALSVFRENEPWLIYLFAEAGPETRALRDYLIKRDDLPAMFEIDLAAGERVGVLESYPTSGNACFPQPELISVIVCDGRCDVADAPVAEGYGIDFSSGLAPIEVDGLYGYTDQTGMLRITPQFEFAAQYRMGRALVRREGLMGMIDMDGAFLVEPRFQEVMGFHGRLWRVSENGLFGLMYETGEMFVEPAYQSLGLNAEMSITATTPDGTAGRIDGEGNFTPDPE